MGKSGKHAKKPVIEDEDEVYHVEVITKARVTAISDSEDDSELSVSDILRKKIKDKNNSQARWEYYVKWAGYDSEANSWEPEENVADCQRLLSSFWDHIGTDNDDYPVGYEIKAQESWIKKEKKYFGREYKGLKEAKKRKDEEGRERHEKHQEKKSKKSTAVRSRSSTASSFTKGKQKAVDVELTSSDSDNDQPLAQLVPAKRKAFVGSDDEDKDQGPAKAQRMGSSTKKPTQRGPIPPETDQGTSNALAESLFTPSPEGISVPKPLPPAKAHPIPLPPRAKKPQAMVRWSKRPPNRHTDIAAGTVDPASIGPSNAIPTKQRLAQQALNPVLPKTAAPPSLASTKHAIKELNFKKSSQITPQTPSPRTPTFVPESVAGPSTLNDSIIPASISRGPALPPSRRTSWGSRAAENRAPEPTAMDVDADGFLHSIMPPQMAAPLVPAQEPEQGPVPPKPLINRTQPTPYKIQKKWKWPGTFTLEHSNGRTGPFNVYIQDCTEAVSGGLRFNFVMDDVKQLIAESFHDVADVATFLRACQPVTQLGRLAAQDSQDTHANTSLSTLSSYMAKRKQVILIPATLDREIVGHMLLFAPDKELCQRFNVPPDLCRQNSLIVALLPWELSAKQIALDWRKPISLILPSDPNVEVTISDTARWERTIRSKVSYHHALHILGFPKALHEFMAREPTRHFCVFYEGGDNTNINNHAGIETNCLMSVMEQCRAGYTNTRTLGTRVVFIHVGALKNVHKFPHLADRRAKRSSMQFYTYGTHESVAPSIWGVREIWPCGGIVTFTPQAALEDFFGLLNRIRQVHAHPLWAPYALPSVVGMISRLICGREDPLVVYDRGEFVFKELLEVIADGELAMITAPRNDQHPISANELSQEWLDEFVFSAPDKERDILQYAITSFNTKYSNMPASERMRAISQEISTDLAHMQKQPAFMKDYRRYVVLQGVREEIPVPDNGLEWATISNFDFGDEFYPRQ